MRGPPKNQRLSASLKPRRSASRVRPEALSRRATLDPQPAQPTLEQPAASPPLFEQPATRSQPQESAASSPIVQPTANPAVTGERSPSPGPSEAVLAGADRNSPESETVHSPAPVPAPVSQLSSQQNRLWERIHAAALAVADPAPAEPTYKPTAPEYQPIVEALYQLLPSPPPSRSPSPEIADRVAVFPLPTKTVWPTADFENKYWPDPHAPASP